MPPLPKAKREMIIDAAYEITREKGFKAVTAREIARRLHCSTSPIFTVYKDMDELKKDVCDKAQASFDAYMAKADEYTPQFKQQGILLIQFAKDEPEIFKLVHSGFTDQPLDIMEVFDKVMQPEELSIIQKEYGLDEEEAYFLYRHVWVMTYGVAALAGNGQYVLTEEEIIRSLGVEFMSTLLYVKSGKHKETTVTPVLNEGKEV